MNKRHILDVVILILCIIFLFVLCFAILQFRENEYTYSERSFYYSMESDNYDNIARMSRTNRVLGKKNGAAYQEYYALADYYEAALYYNIYTKAGDTERAEIRKKAMEDAVSRMGTLSPQKQRIDEILKIE